MSLEEVDHWGGGRALMFQNCMRVTVCLLFSMDCDIKFSAIASASFLLVPCHGDHRLSL